MYAHFTQEDRIVLAKLIRSRMPRKKIAQVLHKHPSSVSRELKRNSDSEGRYYVYTAESKRYKRRKRAHKRFQRIIGNDWLRVFVVRKVKKFWSPDQIAGYLREKYGTTIVCAETIYQYILQHPQLKQYLRCQKGQYKHRYGSLQRVRRRKEADVKKRIDERPWVVELRKRLGDWEGDTVIGKERKHRIYTLVERKSGYLHAVLLKKEAQLARRIQECTVEFSHGLTREQLRTITFDNGSEFAEYQVIENKTNIQVYFAYPYHSWERGTNENTNGLLRQFFPKKMSFATVSPDDLQKAVHLLNHRPRKRLHYLTPHQVFIKNCTSD